jgi:hypothetical protein
VAYNSSKTEKVMWHACMLKELSLVGCSYLDIIDAVEAAGLNRVVLKKQI